MGRPSKLTDAQWEKIGKRLLAGESASALAREFGVSKATISERFANRIRTVKEVANQLVAVDEAFGKLNVSEQFAARSLSEVIKATKNSLASAAASNAGIAQRMSALANAQMQKVDDADPFSEDSVKTIKGVGALLNIVNQASEIPMALIKSAKDFTDDGSNPGKPGQGQQEGIPHAPEYALKTDEPTPAQPIL